MYAHKNSDSFSEKYHDNYHVSVNFIWKSIYSIWIVVFMYLRHSIWNKCGLHSPFCHVDNKIRMWAVSMHACNACDRIHDSSCVLLLLFFLVNALSFFSVFGHICISLYILSGEWRMICLTVWQNIGEWKIKRSSYSIEGKKISTTFKLKQYNKVWRKREDLNEKKRERQKWERQRKIDWRHWKCYN